MATLQSPRIENGVIKWYEGDAFYIRFNIYNLYNGEVIELSDKDHIDVEFYDCRRTVAAFRDIKLGADGLFSIHIDSRLTQSFKVGEYHYKIELHKNDSETIQTIERCGKAEVEGVCECRK